MKKQIPGLIMLAVCITLGLIEGCDCCNCNKKAAAPWPPDTIKAIRTSGTTYNLIPAPPDTPSVAMMMVKPAPPDCTFAPWPPDTIMFVK